MTFIFFILKRIRIHNLSKYKTLVYKIEYVDIFIFANALDEFIYNNTLQKRITKQHSKISLNKNNTLFTINIKQVSSISKKENLT